MNRHLKCRILSSIVAGAALYSKVQQKVAEARHVMEAKDARVERDDTMEDNNFA